MSTGSFHPGEVALQAETGAQRRLAEVGPRFIRDHMPDQHREFFAQLPFLVAGTLGAAGHPQAALLAGPPGFAHSPDPRRLRVDAPLAALDVGAPIGLLGLEAHSRRRNRLNGTVVAVDGAGFEVVVGQSFGNCPKYIQPRVAVFDAAAAGSPASRTFDRLEGEALEFVRHADTFFIATAHPAARETPDPAQGLDVSHRGGPPGFVEAAGGGRVLAVPDYTGNSYFNTFGNLLLEPRCSLLFVDWATAAQLQVAASAEVVRGPQRRLVLHVEGARLTRGALPLRWRPAGVGPG